MSSPLDHLGSGGSTTGASLVPRRLRARLPAWVPTVHRNLAWPAAFFLAYAFLLRNVVVGRLYAFGDYPPFFGGAALDAFASTWQTDMLGYAQPLNTGAAYVGALTSVGGVAAQNLFYLLLLPGCFLAFRHFVSRFVSREPARTLAAAVYAINPVTIGQFANGGGNELLSLLGMPLVLHYLWETVERDDWRAAFTAGVVFGATTIIPWTSFWILFPYATYLLYRCRAAPRTALKLAFAGLVGVTLALPNLYYLLLRAKSLGSTGALFDVLDFTYADATPLLLARLAGNRGSYAMGLLGYNDESMLLVGLVIPLVAVVALRRRRVRVFGVAAAGIVAFVLATTHGLTYPLFEVVPPLFSLKNPNKLYYSLLVATGVLFGVGVDELLVARAGDGVDLVRATLLAILVLSLASYAAPAADGLGLAEMRGDDYYVPEEYDAVGSAVDGRVLWLPYTYTTQLRLRHVQPAHVGIRAGGLVEGRENEALVESLFADVAAGEPVDDRLRALGVTHVVVDRLAQTRVNSHVGAPRVREMGFVPYVFGDPARFATWLDDSGSFHLDFETEHLSVYRVAGAERRADYERSTGLHRLYYPTEPHASVVGPDRLTNGDFADGLDGWWTWRGDSGTQTSAVETDAGTAALLETADGNTYPVAQEVRVESGAPYRISVNATGPGIANLLWYDGEKAASNLVAREAVPLAALPRTVTAEADLLSLRIRPNASRLLVESAAVRRTTVPPATGYEASTGAVPGVSVDGWAAETDAGTAVGVNLDAATASAVDPAVRIVDAETALAGELVFDERLRQGAGVRLPDGEMPASVPADATVHATETANGTVLDYWVTGAFDETPVTVLYTSYHENWRGPPGSTHFRAAGWANGYTDAEPSEIRWTGGDDLRRTVLVAWIGCWIVALLVLVGWWYRDRRGGERGSPAASVGRDAAGDAPSLGRAIRERRER